jgi:hypothetical protein
MARPARATGLHDGSPGFSVHHADTATAQRTASGQSAIAFIVEEGHVPLTRFRVQRHDVVAHRLFLGADGRAAADDSDGSALAGRQAVDGCQVRYMLVPVQDKANAARRAP